MESLVSRWNALSAVSKGVVVAAALFILIGLAVLVRMTARPEMALLYSGLDAGSAAEVAAALEAEQVPFEVRGTRILVPVAARDSLRLRLAGQGVPANGPAGYELLDSLTGFGTTAQMFDAAYWRAKEGELARTIVSSPAVESARVHISMQGTRPFSRRQTETASVTLTGTSGAIDPGQARAVRYLVASAVPGLVPENVAVIDGRSGQMIDDSADGVAPGSASALEDALRDRATALLDARLGPGNAVVAVTVERVRQRESIRERILDPDSRVMISSDTEERSATATDSRTPAVTVASNLPDGDAAAEAGGSSSDDAETRERVNYDVSETTRELQRDPGGIARMTVAILINAEAAGIGEASARELDDLAALVGAAVGLNSSRGDALTLHAQPFTDSAAETPGTPATEAGDGLTAWMRTIQIGLVGLVILALGFGVLRPLLLGRRPPLSPAAGALPLPDRGGALAAPPPAAIQPLKIASDPLPLATAPVAGGKASLVERLGGQHDGIAKALQSWIEPPAGDAT